MNEKRVVPAVCVSGGNGRRAGEMACTVSAARGAEAAADRGTGCVLCAATTVGPASTAAPTSNGAHETRECLVMRVKYGRRTSARKSRWDLPMSQNVYRTEARVACMLVNE